MSTKKGFRVLEHTADEYIMAYGASLAEAFESAALAMFEVMTDTGTVKPKEKENIEVKAEDEKSLLYVWLEELLIKFDAEGKIYSKFDVSRISRVGEDLFLEAAIWGETYDPDRHPAKTSVKAITYYRMEILKEEKKVTVKFILDI